jgi:hypothetical protein
MTERGENVVPAHLQELLQPTPSGTAKFIAAWDGLPADRQMAILSARKKQAGPDYLYNRIILKALTSGNAFVRYLAARELYLTDGDPLSAELKTKIESDPEPLVRFANLETSSPAMDPELKEADSFYALPQEARLAKVRNLTDGGQHLAAIIAYAADHKLKDGTVTEIELSEILFDYLNKFWRLYGEERLSSEGYGLRGEDIDAPWEHIPGLRGDDVKALWELVLKVPERISRVIIELLPEHGLSSNIPADILWTHRQLLLQRDLSSHIPSHVLEAMSDRQLGVLLDRDDIDLPEFRKQKFFELAQGDDDEKDFEKRHLRRAAISHNFDLTDEEFASILAKPAKSRVKDLSDLAMWAKDLRLCLLDAVHDALSASDVNSTDFYSATDAKRSFERKLQEFKGWQRKEQLLELKLYRLAVTAAPWKKNAEAFQPSGDLAFLADAVVEHDPWATFICFSRNLRSAGRQAESVEADLPIIWEAGEEAPPEKGPAERIVSRLTRAMDDALDGSDSDASRIAKAVVKVVGEIVSEDRQALNVIRAELADLTTRNTRLLKAVWIVIGLLAAILLAHL